VAAPNAVVADDDGEVDDNDDGGYFQDRQILCATQLETSSRPMSRIKLKVFGSSGVGKTALIESLKCGYLGGLLRSTFRSPLSSSLSVDAPASVLLSASPGRGLCVNIRYARSFSMNSCVGSVPYIQPML